MPQDWTPEKLLAMSAHVDEASLHNRDQAASWRRWVLASCLSINGGAIIALLNLAAIDANARKWAIIWFVAGLIVCVVFGALAAVINDQFAGYYKLSSWNIRNRTIAAEGKPAEPLDVARLDTLIARDRRVFWIQFVSPVCFLVGLVIAFNGLS